MGSMSNRRNPRNTFIEYKIVNKSGISGDEMNGFVTKWLGGGWTKMVEIEVNGQMITHDFSDPDRMYSSYPKTLVPIWEIWWRDAMGPFICLHCTNLRLHATLMRGIQVYPSSPFQTFLRNRVPWFLTFSGLWPVCLAVPYIYCYANVNVN